MDKLRIVANSAEIVVFLPNREEEVVPHSPAMGKDLLLTIGKMLKKADKTLGDMSEIVAEYDPKSTSSATQITRVTVDILQFSKNVENYA